MCLNLFSLLFGFSALLANSLVSATPAELSTYQQKAGSNVAKVSSILFAVQCLLGSVYILFLSWRGLRRYSSTHIQAYSRISQDPDDNNGPLLEQDELNLWNMMTWTAFRFFLCTRVNWVTVVDTVKGCLSSPDIIMTKSYQDTCQVAQCHISFVFC